jgi:hypothetical protein
LISNAPQQVVDISPFTLLDFVKMSPIYTTGYYDYNGNDLPCIVYLLVRLNGKGKDYSKVN